MAVGLMTVTAEQISARRFVQAWRRFKDAEKLKQVNSTDEEQLLLQQYLHMANEFRRKQAVNEASDSELASIVQEIQALLSTAAASLASASCTAFRLPTPAELRERRALTLQKQQMKRKESEVCAAAVKREQEDTAQQSSDSRRPPDAVSAHEDEFKSMLDPVEAPAKKPTAQEIRKRLGLVDRHDQVLSASETVAREEQDAIQSDMMSLAKQLKERTQTINQSLAEDVKILDAVGQRAESNTTLLDRENAALKKQLASSIGLWTSLFLVLGVVGVFIAMYLYIKIFSRRRW